MEVCKRLRRAYRKDPHWAKDIVEAAKYQPAEKHMKGQDEVVVKFMKFLKEEVRFCRSIAKAEAKAIAKEAEKKA